VQEQRRARLTEELAQLTARLGPVVDPAAVFLPERETVMRPHLIAPLLEQGIFADYPSAARWLKANLRPTVQVSRLELPAAIALIHAAGGQATLAHPGYGVVEGWLDPERDLPALAALGLDAVEIEYPYALCSPHLFDLAREQDVIARLRAVAARCGLAETAGSDSHRREEFLTRWAVVR
jgi:predicted metal-dependent phosphoesterase TrpH